MLSLGMSAYINCYLHMHNNIILMSLCPQVFQVPLEECSTLTTCGSCTDSPNPLCGWCTVEQKCSRRFQCQNSTDTMRWVNNGYECVSSVVSPSKFTVGIKKNVSSDITAWSVPTVAIVTFPPLQVNVTVTPSLPPALSGETYFCYFRESEGSIKFNTSAVSEDGVLYTCNLNGSVPIFKGAKLGNLITHNYQEFCNSLFPCIYEESLSYTLTDTVPTVVIDFSFVSSLINVLFGTEKEALNLINCTAATR